MEHGDRPRKKKRFTNLSVPPFLLENMLKTHEEQLEQNAYKYNQN
jgi:hypothetical protein